MTGRRSRVNRRGLLKLSALAAPALILPSRSRAAELLGVQPSNQATYNSPFSAQSIWKAKPVNPVLQGFVTNSPNANNIFPVAGGGPIYWAHPTDPPVNVTVSYIPDELRGRTVTLPHFPSNAVPGTSSDHLMCIFDSTTNLIHEFWLTAVNGTSWTANNYGCSSAIPSNPVWYGGAADHGLGIGTPARPYSGVSASGKTIMSGVMRAWELDGIINRGTFPQHAIYVFCDYSLITANTATTGPGPQFPATLQDSLGIYYGANQGTASWPLGQLMMLPPTFNVNSMTQLGSKAIAQTLMTYGCYLMDTGKGIFSFSGEHNTSFANSWYGYTSKLRVDGTFLDSDLKPILSSLQAVASVSGWLDGNGNPFTPTPFANMNLIGMRGPWARVSGRVSGGYYTDQNAYVVPPGSAAFSAQARLDQPCLSPNPNGPWWNWSFKNGWSTAPTLNRSYALTVYGTGNLTVRLLVYDQTVTTNYYDSGVLTIGQSVAFAWPNQASTSTLVQITNPANGGGKIRLELVGN